MTKLSRDSRKNARYTRKSVAKYTRMQCVKWYY